MFWWLLLGVSGVLLVVGIILWVAGSIKWFNNCEISGMVLTFVFGFIFLLTVSMVPVFYVGNLKETETFKQQKYYIEEIAPTLPDTDNYALTQKRIELNEWLYNAQYDKTHYNFFSLYPDEVLNLEVIK